MTTAEGRRRPRLATVLAVLAVLALVPALAVGGWAAVRAPALAASGFVGDDVARAEQDRLAVLQAAERFTETWNTFSADDAQGYLDEVAPLLTTKFRAEFTDAATDVATGIEQQQLSSQGEVLVDAEGIPLVAIASMDADSAEVLVVSDARRTTAGQDVLRHWRWQISLVKDDGQWLVDEFEEV